MPPTTTPAELPALALLVSTLDTVRPPIPETALPFDAVAPTVRGVEAETIWPRDRGIDWPLLMVTVT